MGNVHLAVDEALACEVALQRAVVPGDALARLRDEVRLAQRVTHPDVCRTFDLHEIDGNQVAKMEYIAGETLAERLGRGRHLRDRTHSAAIRETLGWLDRYLGPVARWRLAGSPVPRPPGTRRELPWKRPRGEQS